MWAMVSGAILSAKPTAMALVHMSRSVVRWKLWGVVWGSTMEGKSKSDGVLEKVLVRARAIVSEKMC